MIVTGNDITLYYHDVDSDTDIPFACARGCEMQISPTFKNTTDADSAFYRKRKRDITDWSISIDGLLTLENYSYLFLTNLEETRETILVKFVVDNGTDGLVIYSGLVYCGPFTITGNFKEVATYSVQLIGTGAYSTQGTQVTPTGILVEGGSVTPFEWTGVDGPTITVPSTIGASVIVNFFRGAANQPRIIYSGVPVGPQIRFNTATGEFTAPADTPFTADEIGSGSFK